MGSLQTPITVRSSALLENSCGYLLQELQARSFFLLRKKVDYANMARSRLHQELAESESEFTHLLLSLGERSVPERLEKKKAAAESNLTSGARPGTSARRMPNRSLNTSFSSASASPTHRSMNGSPSNRRFSLGDRQTGSNSSQGSPLMKERTKTLRQKMYSQSEFGSHLRDETASVVSTFSGPLSPDF